MNLDLLIKGGLIFDGYGLEPYEADIGISGDKIAFINKKSKIRSQQFNHSYTSFKKEGRRGFDRVIEAEGLSVAPGFIDTHAHSEFTLLADPRAEGKICQGITTEINGNCGLSAAPLYGEALEQRETDLAELGIEERWSTFKEYYEILKKGISLNFVTLAGHGNIRACITGYKDKTLTLSEIKKMKGLLRKAISEGAVGISTGLIYPPGIYSTTEELTEIAKCCNKLIFASHMRSEGDELLESIKEIIRIGREADIKVHISHIKTSGKKNWYKIDDAVLLIEKAREKGIEITCDRYPYNASSTDLDTMLPSWAYEGGAEEELKKLKNLDCQKTMKKEILNEYYRKGYWESINIASVSSKKNRWMEGKSIAYIASRKTSKPIDILFQILIEEKLRASAIFSVMKEDNLRRFLSLPYIMIGTDSSARCDSGPTHKGKPHPRGYGSFPRFLGKHIREERIMSMGKAIQKITMLPARTFSIKKRGAIKKGYFADIVVFDQGKIIDRATYNEPFLKPKGIYYVIINGLPAVWEGRLTGVNAGKILRHGR
ncbi:MAG: hypothetical protein A2Y97_03010 [Nitrospirae bacterium RBG_13_39_12]|nr:MAG: hypothetical protein A2Y97_03010 [Nitrospirae bacterium RBG_13_39_12]